MTEFQNGKNILMNCIRINKMFKCSGYGLGELISRIENPIGVEIGCSEGHTSEFLLDSNQNLILTAIDPYQNYLDWNGRYLNDREEFYHSTLSRLSRFGDRFKIIRSYSDDVFSLFADESLDFVFVDGLHTYDQVKKDCANYYSKVKTGSIFAKSVGKEILTTECDVWYWYK
jgi:hypothetical protein